MNRKSFLRKFGLGVIAVAFAPKVLAEKSEVICSADPAIPGGDITTIKLCQWGGLYSQQELLVSLRLQEDFYRILMSGERNEYYNYCKKATLFQHLGYRKHVAECLPNPR